MLERMRRPVAAMGHRVIEGIWRVGCIARFFALVLASSGTSFQRFRLVMREIYFTGVLSLMIIVVSGLFVGMVLGLQGYETLQSYGATESIGVLVALSLVRELGPVVAALLFASRAGSAITAEIGLMKATEQLSAMEMMAVDPMARVVAPRFWAGVISMPLLAALFSAMGIFGGYIVAVVLIGVDNGAVLVADAGGGRLPGGRAERRDQERRVRFRHHRRSRPSRATTPRPPPKACRAPPPVPW